MKRVLFIMSDTGGGHRAAAEAIRDALQIEYPRQLDIKLVDAFRGYSPFPFKYAPELYPIIVNNSKPSWSVSYKLSNTRRRARVLSRTMYVTIERGLKKMIRENPADVVVCVHSLLATPSMRALMQLEKRPPFVTVVTDLVSTHMLWYDRRAERCLVPTEPAYQRGLEAGLTPDQMRITGLPVHPRFSNNLAEKHVARAELGWHQHLPTIMVIGGGEGMGPLYKTARAINDANLDCQIVIVSGRNKTLKTRLENADWQQPTHIYGFVTDMPKLMSAADILVTKAGPATISEACIAGLPMVLYDAIPGQETGNVDYVVQNNAGVFAPSPDEVAENLQRWLQEGIAGIKQRSENARGLGRPNAVWDIAQEIYDYAHTTPLATNRRTIWYDIKRRARQLPGI